MTVGEDLRRRKKNTGRAEQQGRLAVEKDGDEPEKEETAEGEVAQRRSWEEGFNMAVGATRTDATDQPDGARLKTDE